MVTRKLDDTLIVNAASEARRKFGGLKLVPSLAVDVVAIGGTFIHVQVGWTTHLAEGSLKVVLDNGAQTDITARLALDPVAMTASGDIDTGAVGVQVVRASGEFLARLAPLQSVVLGATGAAYLSH